MRRTNWIRLGLTAACAALTAVAWLAQPSAQTVNQPTLRFVQSNGIRMRIAEMGQGPLVLLLHGWPESWYSWRHQLPAIAAAGFHAVAPDMRGYGQTDKPAAVADYDIHHLTADVVGLIDALGEKTAVVVGHDWGAIVAWNSVLLHPSRFTGARGDERALRGRGQPSRRLKTGRRRTATTSTTSSTSRSPASRRPNSTRTREAS